MVVSKPLQPLINAVSQFLRRSDLNLTTQVTTSHPHPLTSPEMCQFNLITSRRYLGSSAQFRKKGGTLVISMRKAMLHIDYHQNLRSLLSPTGSPLENQDFLSFMGATMARMHEDGHLNFQMNLECGALHLHGQMHSRFHIDRYDAPHGETVRRSNVQLVSNEIHLQVEPVNDLLPYMLL